MKSTEKNTQILKDSENTNLTLNYIDMVCSICGSLYNDVYGMGLNKICDKCRDKKIRAVFNKLKEKRVLN